MFILTYFYSNFFFQFPCLLISHLLKQIFKSVDLCGQFSSINYSLCKENFLSRANSNILYRHCHRSVGKMLNMKLTYSFFSQMKQTEGLQREKEASRASFFLNVTFIFSNENVFENSDISLTFQIRKNTQHWQTQFLHPHVLDLRCCFWKLLPLVLSPLSGMNLCRHRASQQNNLSGSSKSYKTELWLITQCLWKRGLQTLCLNHKGHFTFCTWGVLYIFCFLNGYFLVVQVLGDGYTYHALQFHFHVIVVFRDF